MKCFVLELEWLALFSMPPLVDDLGVDEIDADNKEKQRFAMYRDSRPTGLHVIEKTMRLA